MSDSISIQSGNGNTGIDVTHTALPISCDASDVSVPTDDAELIRHNAQCLMKILSGTTLDDNKTTTISFQSDGYKTLTATPDPENGQLPVVSRIKTYEQNIECQVGDAMPVYTDGHLGVYGSKVEFTCNVQTKNIADGSIIRSMETYTIYPLFAYTNPEIRDIPQRTPVEIPKGTKIDFVSSKVKE